MKQRLINHIGQAAGALQAKSAKGCKVWICCMYQDQSWTDKYYAQAVFGKKKKKMLPTCLTKVSYQLVNIGYWSI